MAKPGSNGARQIAAGGGVSLAGKALSDEQAQYLQERLELMQGTRCNGCGRRITIGMQFTSLDPRNDEEPVKRMAACARDDCGFAEDARHGATYAEMVEFAWMDENGPDAPAAKIVVERNRRRAERQEADAAKERDDSEG